MMKNAALALALLMLYAMSSLAGWAAASSTTTVKSTVTISSGEGTEFKGKVSSPKKRCRAHRTVKLYMRAGSARSADTLVGTDVTDASGAWSIEGSFVAGIYYARVVAALIHVNGIPVRCAYDWTIPMRY